MKNDFFLYNLENNELSFSTLKWYFLYFFHLIFVLSFPKKCFVKIGFISFCIIPFRFVSVNFVSIYFVSHRFRLVSVNLVSRFVSHFTGTRYKHSWHGKRFFSSPDHVRYIHHLASVVRPLTFSYFNLLLWNNWAKWNQTWQKVSI